jgi:hypothetical protein
MAAVKTDESIRLATDALPDADALSGEWSYL